MVKWSNLSVIAAIFLIFPGSVSAQELSSPNYKLEFGNFSMTSGTKSSELYQIRDTVGQTASEVYGSSGYILKAGAGYTTGTAAFRFTIDQTSIHFPSLYPDQPQTADLVLQVFLGAASGYQILTAATDDLKSREGSIIAATHCDDPTDPCKPTQARPWTSPLTYGLGFSVSGSDSSADFENGKLYRPFANLGLGNSSVQILSGDAKDKEHLATLRVKINISEDQSAGIYQNTLRFAALPGY